jgi:DNA-binding NtrC family response regulator
MVLDDEAIVGARLRPVLERAGFEVEVFTDSAAAIDRLAQVSFDVLVTDLKLPGLGGGDVLRHVRRHSPSTRVIVITGYATSETGREANALGAFQFVPKPFRLGELVKLVETAARH